MKGQTVLPLVGLFVSFCVFGAAFGAVIVTPIQFGVEVMYNATAPDSQIFRLPTAGISGLITFNINVTANSNSYVIITRGSYYPFSVYGGLSPYPYSQVTYNGSYSIQSYAEGNSADHYLTPFQAVTPSFYNITITVDPLPVAPTISSDFTVVNTSIVANGGSYVTIPIAQFLASGPFDNSHISQIEPPLSPLGSPAVDLYSFSLGARSSVSWYTALNPGIKYQYTHYRYYPSSYSNTHAYAISQASSPIEISPNTPTQITLTAFRHKNIYLRLNGLTGYRISNISLAVTVGGTRATDYAVTYLRDSRWPNYRNAPDSFAVSQPNGRIVHPLNCYYDGTNRLAFATVVFYPTDYTLAEIAAQTRQVTITVELISDVIEPIDLAPNTRVEVPSGETRFFRLIAFGAAVAKGTTITFIGNRTSYLGFTGGFDVSGCSSTGLMTVSSGSRQYDACSITDYVEDNVNEATMRITGPASFNYTIGSYVQATSSPQWVQWIGSKTILGPSDPSLYPLVVRIAPQAQTPQTISVYAAFGACSGTSNARFICSVPYYNAPQTCDVVLSCPGEMVYLTSSISSYYTENTTYSYLPASGITVYNLALSGSTQQSYTVPAQSQAPIKVSVPAGSDPYVVTIVSTTGAFDSSSVQFQYYVGGCDGTTLSTISSTYVNSSARSMTISKSGLLMLTTSQYTIVFTVAFRLNTPAPTAAPTPSASYCSSSATIPAQCQGRIADQIYTLSYFSSSVANQISTLNATLYLLAPEEFQTNSLCYQAFLTAACNFYTPRCNVDGTQKLYDNCPAQCKARMAANGCTSGQMYDWCDLMSTCAPAPPLPFVAAAPVISGAPGYVYPPLYYSGTAPSGSGSGAPKSAPQAQGSNGNSPVAGTSATPSGSSQTSSATKVELVVAWIALIAAMVLLL